MLKIAQINFIYLYDNPADRLYISTVKMYTYKVVCFGAGFVGIPTSSVLALKNPDKQFIVFDINATRIQLCKENRPHIYEQGLVDLLHKVNGANLSFTTDISEGLSGASVIFLALPTPTKTFGYNKGKAYDLSYTQIAIRDIVKYYNEHPMEDSVIIVEKSTVPIGTAQMITKIIAEMSIKENVNKYVISSNPQFLAEGTAVYDLMDPDRVVLGHQENENIDKLKGLYHYVPKEKVILTNQHSSELSKLVNNCFLAQRVSSINSISILCEEYEADVKEIKTCIGLDKRIGNKFINSSVGFGGSCFKKDILALTYLAELKGLEEVAAYWRAVIDMNQYRKKMFFERIFQTLNFNIKHKKICIFGTAFKKDTNDPRESPAVKISHYLLEEGAKLQLYDPETKLENFIEEMKWQELWKEEYLTSMAQKESPEEAVQGTYAIIVMTEWDIFRQLNYRELFASMQRPAYIFDGRNLLDETAMKEIGFLYYRVGKAFKHVG